MQIDNLNNALSVLIQAAVIGQNKGIYTLKEAGYISSAIEYIEFLSNSNKSEEKELTTEEKIQ